MFEPFIIFCVRSIFHLRTVSVCPILDILNHDYYNMDLPEEI